MEPNDPAALAEKAVVVLGDETKAKQLGEGGRKYVQQFSEPAIAERWEKIYGQVIKSYNERNHLFDL